jgi:hypothetical protein
MDYVTETFHEDSSTLGGLTRQECLAQIDRLMSSPLLQRSENLCKLVKYLADHTLNAPTHHLKEHQIATEALGRSSEFDPQLDASVRVLAGRLRTRLAEYYQSAGVRDPIVVDVPKGTYMLSFERRPDALEPGLPAAAPVTGSPESPRSTSDNQARVLLALAILAIGLLVTGFAIDFIHHRSAALTAKKDDATDLPTSFQILWNPFFHGAQETIVVFSNPLFVGNPETGFRYFDPSRDSRDKINQHYTGIGELLGVAELDGLFQKSGGKFRIKPGAMFTFDEARDNDLIFVGSPTENLSLRQIPTPQEFVFRRVPAGENRWNEVIADLHPRAGQSGIYPPASEIDRQDTDYALIALMRGLDRSRWTLILAGRSTVSTEAAVDYVCDPRSLRELLQHLNISKAADLKPFEALLRIKSAKDVPIETQLVDSRQTNY